jgi:Tyrosyl-DNA phosphodiesterase
MGLRGECEPVRKCVVCVSNLSADIAHTNVVCRGRLVQDKAKKAPKLNCRNWECGVVIPVPKHKDIPEGLGLESFNEKISVPMQYPGKVFENSTPWFFGE